MRKNPYPGILTVLVLTGIFMACSPASTQMATQSPEPETETPIPTAVPTETATLVLLPTASLAPVTLTPRFAPFCEPDVVSTLTASQCQLPIAEESSVFCTNKVPYNLIFLDTGATYEVLSDGFKCSDAGMKDGKQMLTCTGPMASTFELRVCGQACALQTPQAEITQCPQGFLYNDPQGCCAHIPQSAEQSCVVLTLKTKHCVIGCEEFTAKAACDKHYPACEWNDEDKVCQMKP